MNQEIRLDLQQSKIRIFQGIVTLKNSGLSVQKKQNIFLYLFGKTRVSVQGVKSLGGNFACLCRGFEFYEVKKNFFCYYFSKRKWKYFYTFNHFYSEKSSKRAK